MFARGLKPLSIASVVLIVGAFALVFFYAPNDADQGFIQKIFYLHVPLAIVALGGFVTGGIWWVASIDALPAQPGAAAGFADAAFALSGVVAPSVMGFIVTSTGSYSSGFVVMTVLAVTGAAAMLLLPKRDVPREAPPAESAPPRQVRTTRPIEGSPATYIVVTVVKSSSDCTFGFVISR